MHENERILKFSPLIRNLYNSARETLGFEPHVSISIINSTKNANNPLGRTAHYSPSEHKIALYTRGRHIKDIMRSLAHELVHHNQNCRGDFENAGGTMPGYAQEDGHMREMEREAYEVGNLLFRDWEDKLKDKGGKPLFSSTAPYVPAPTSGVVGGRLVEENKMTNKVDQSLWRQIKKIKKALDEQEAPRKRKVFYKRGTTGMGTTGGSDEEGPGASDPGLTGHPGFKRGKAGEPDYLDVPTGVEDTVPHDDPYRPKLKAPKRRSPGGCMIGGRGCKGKDVWSIQQALVRKGYLTKDDVDGDFGPKTDKAVRAYQGDWGHKVDGIVGVNTARGLSRKQVKPNYGLPAGNLAPDQAGPMQPGSKLPVWDQEKERNKSFRRTARNPMSMGKLEEIVPGGGGKLSYPKTGGGSGTLTAKKPGGSQGTFPQDDPSPMGQGADVGPTPGADVETWSPSPTMAQAEAGKAVIKKYHQGKPVEHLQKLLKDAGHPVKVDGDFGRRTDRAVRAYQKTYGLKVDGRVGPETAGSMLKATGGMSAQQAKLHLARKARARKRAGVHKPPAPGEKTGLSRGMPTRSADVRRADWARRAKKTDDWWDMGFGLKENEKTHLKETGLRNIIQDVIQEMFNNNSSVNEGFWDQTTQMEDAEAAERAAQSGKPYEAGYTQSEGLQDTKGHFSDEGDGKVDYEPDFMDEGGGFDYKKADAECAKKYPKRGSLGHKLCIKRKRDEHALEQPMREVSGEEEGKHYRRNREDDEKHLQALEKDIDYDKRHESLEETFFPTERNIRDKARNDLNEGLMKRWGYTNKEK